MPDFQPEAIPENSCSIQGGCPPSHRAMRRTAYWIIGVLLFAIAAGVLYVVLTSRP